MHQLSREIRACINAGSMHPHICNVFFALALTLAGASGLAHAHEHKTGSLRIVHPWVRATPTGAQVAGGFVTIINAGSAPDRLLGGTIAKGARTEVHATSIEDGIARMRPVEGGLEIKPGATVELKPGGLHLMFVDLKEPLKEGQTVRGTLTFEKAGSVEVEYTVRGMGGAAPAEHKH
jgi:copper(I)-binding protein